MNPEGLPQLSGACLYSNPPLLLSLRVFLTPPSLRTPPLYFAVQNAGEEGESNLPLIAVQYSAYGARQGEKVILDFVTATADIFLTPPSFGHLPYILLCKTQGRGWDVFPFRFCSDFICHTPQCYGARQGRWLGVAYFSSFLDTRGMRIDVYNCRTAATVSNIIQSGSSLNMKYEEATKKREENVSMW